MSHIKAREFYGGNLAVKLKALPEGKRKKKSFKKAIGELK